MITHLGQLQCLRRDLTGLSPEAYAALDAAIVALTQPDALTSQPSGEAVVIPVVQQTAPERIWLAVADDAYYADKPFPDGEEVCWSSDAPLQVCVPYVRADLATNPSADARGEACFRFRPAGEPHFSNWIDGNAPAYPPGVEVQRAYLRPSADAPGEAVDEWVAVADRLPEPRIRVMTFDGFIVRESFYGMGHFRADRWEESCWRHSEQSETPVRWEVTHWRPLPAPPAALAPKPEGGHG